MLTVFRECLLIGVEQSALFVVFALLARPVLPLNDETDIAMTRPSTARIVGLGLLVAFAATSISVLPAAPSFANVVWDQIGGDIDGEAADNYSGSSVSSSSDGRTVAIGAPRNDDSGVDAGHVRVYTFAGGVWGQLGGDINGEAAGDLSGYSVSSSSDGRTVAIGAPHNDDGDVDAGHVRVYTFAGGVWGQLGGDINGEAAYDSSGYSVSLSSDGRTVAIGAPYNVGNGVNAGQVRVYTFAGGVWGQLGVDINGEAAGDSSGYSVSLSSDGRTVAIGAPYNVGNGVNAGQVRVYTFASGAWGQLGVDINGEAAGDLSGFSVSLSGDGSMVAIGAPMNAGGNANAGHVRVYAFASGAWGQVGDDIDGEDTDSPDAIWGLAVSLSSDGNTVAIGTGFFGSSPDVGTVRIYTLAAGAWGQVGGDLDGEAADDGWGESVSLSGDGSTVAVGAAYDDGGGVYAGHVRVFNSTVTSAPPNVSPVFSSGTTGSGVAGTASTVYTAVATDADGNPLTYLLGSAVAGFTINASTGVVLMGAGVVAGSYVLSVVASDGTASVTQVVTVTVSPAAVLARTGSDIGGLSTGALALLILGLVAVAFTRRQERGNGFLIS
jgi:hypothetical protein